MWPAGPITMVAQSKKANFPFTGCLEKHLTSQGHSFTWGQNWVAHYKCNTISSSPILCTGQFAAMGVDTVQCTQMK